MIVMIFAGSRASGTCLPRYLRAFHGRYLDVEGPTVRARYGDRGKWQQFMVCPYLGSSAASSSSAPCLETAGAAR